MFDRLDDILIHFEEVMLALGEPDVTGDQNRFRRLMKEQADLAPIVEAYKAYKQAKQDIEDSLALLDEESWPRRSCPTPGSGWMSWNGS